MLKQNNSPEVLATLQPARARRFPTSTAVKTLIITAPFALAGLASAADEDVLNTMGTKVTGGVSTVTTIVGTIVGACLLIGLIIWGGRKFKPHG